MAQESSRHQDHRFNRALYAAARSLGWLIPQTEEEVAAQEALPESTDAGAPGDPLEVLDREPVFPMLPPDDVGAVAEGGAEFGETAPRGRDPVTEGIEPRGRRDRGRAEEDAGGDQGDPAGRPGTGERKTR